MSTVYIVVRNQVAANVEFVCVHPTYKGLSDFIAEHFGVNTASMHSVESREVPDKMTAGVEKVVRIFSGKNATQYYVLETKGS